LNRPTYDRHGRSFEELFRAAPREVVGLMDRAGDDVPVQAPAVPVALGQVGLTRERVPVSVAHPFQPGTAWTLTCRVKVATAVPADRRGLHMSRLGDLIAAAASKVYGSLDEFARELAAGVGHSQYGGASEAEVSGWLPFWEAVPGRDAGKDKMSLEEVGLTVTARTGKGTAKLTTGLIVEHITACPCVQLTLRHARSTGAADARLDPGPLMTHSQRCRTHVQFSHHEHEIRLADVLRAVDGVVFRTQNTLPREHELNLVYRAHDRPQFIEDVARGLLVACGRVVGADHPNCRIDVSSTSMESIHSFDIFANASATVAELEGLGA